MKLKKLNCDETQKIKFWWNSKTQIVVKLKKNPVVMKLKYSNGDKKSKTQIVTKLKNSKGDITQKLKLWKKRKTQKYDFLSKLKLWQNKNCD